MPSEDIGPSKQENKGRSGFGENTGLITVIATLLTVLGGIAVAFINKSPTTTPPISTPGPTVEHPPDPAKQAVAPIIDPIPEQDQTPSGVMNPLQLQVGLMGGTDYANRYVDNVNACYEMCRVDKKCRAMTFIYSNRMCYLKSAVTASAPNSDMASATKLSP